MIRSPPRTSLLPYTTLFRSTEEFSPGFRASRFSYVMSLLHPRVIRDLELSSFGLQVLPANDLFCPLGADEHIVFRSEEHTSELQSHVNLVCRLLLEKNNYTR